MYVVISGCGSVGYHLTKALLTAGHEVTVVDPNPHKAELLRAELGIEVVTGSGTSRKDLEKAGTSRAQVFVSAADLDETNLVACQVARHLFKVPRTMSVIRDPKNDSLFRVLGIDVAVNANHMLVYALEEGFPGQPLVHLMQTRLDQVQLVSITVPEDAEAAGQSLAGLELPRGSIINLVIKSTGPELPHEDMVLEAHDQVIAVVSTDEIPALFDILTGA